MNFKDFKDYVSKIINTLYKKTNDEEKRLLDLMVNYINKMSEKEITLTNYLKEQINECKLTGNDEDYIRLDVYEEILSKIEKE